MSDNGKTSDAVIQIPDKVFPFMDLPREIRDKIYGFAAVKPDGHIGEADQDGVECAFGAALLHNDGLSADSSDNFHFPSGCRHPVHEKKQLFQDFRSYRCLNFALTCYQVYEELTTLFFEQNGFELRDPHDLMRFFLLIGTFHASLIKELRLFRSIQLKFEDFLDIFGPAWVTKATFYQMLEQEYLNDDEPGSHIVRVLDYIKTCDNIKNFELIYRFELPGEYFGAVREGRFGYTLNSTRDWFGESLQWNVHTENVLKKLRQGHGEEADNEIDVELVDFKANDLAAHFGALQGEQDQFAFVFMTACVAHAENCVEWAE